MGYGYFCPLMVYGFVEEIKDNKILSSEYLEINTNHRVRSYAGKINRNVFIFKIIGIEAKIEKDKLIYDEKDFIELLNFKERYEKYHKKEVILKYYPVIKGDYENDYDIEEYELNDEEK
jgi:hypothetical protein